MGHSARQDLYFDLAIPSSLAPVWDHEFGTNYAPKALCMLNQGQLIGQQPRSQAVAGNAGQCVWGHSSNHPDVIITVKKAFLSATKTRLL